MIFQSKAKYSHQGKRDYQEDSYSSGDNYLLVCDGIGGLAKGEIASKLVADTVEEWITLHEPTCKDIERWSENLIDECMNNLISYARDNEQSWNMGTTLALLIMVEGFFYSIHIGDSRIYHFANDGKIKWQSNDHSLVQELLNAKVITAEQAAEHPKRNVITRSLQAKEGHKTQASTYQLENIENDDIFLVCSDGVNEAWTDEGLAFLMGTKATMEEKINEIEKLCQKESRDNNTAIIAQIGVAGGTIGKVNDMEKDLGHIETISPRKRKPLLKVLLYLTPLLLLWGWFARRHFYPLQAKESVVIIHNQARSDNGKVGIKEQIKKENRLWAKTKKSDIPQEYRDYLTQFPQGNYINQAMQNLATLDTVEWQKAILADTENSYSRYLQLFKSGAFNEEARIQILSIKDVHTKDSLARFDDTENIIILDTDSTENKE